MFLGTETNSDLKSFIDDISNVEKDGKLFKIRSEIPTTGFTNWISMFTVNKIF